MDNEEVPMEEGQNDQAPEQEQLSAEQMEQMEQQEMVEGDQEQYEEGMMEGQPDPNMMQMDPS